jgi:hypothetical protein
MRVCSLCSSIGLGLSAMGSLHSMDGLSLRVLTWFVFESTGAMYVVCHRYRHLWVS